MLENIDVFIDNSRLPNVVYYRFHKGWRWDDYRNAVDYDLTTIAPQLEGIPHDVIGDFTSAPSVPVNGTGLSIVANALDRPVALRGISVAVSPTALIRMLANTMLQLHPRHSKRFFVVDNVERAYEFIAKKRKEQDGV